LRLSRIVSGGQTGVDRGALDAALDARFPCGGWCPAGRRAEDGAIPPRYPLNETAETDYTVRTRMNVEHSDATLIFAPGDLTGGTLLTRKICERSGRPCLVIDADRLAVDAAVDLAAGFLSMNDVRVLNVAGPRASGWSGAADYARAVVAGLIDRPQPISERRAAENSDSVVSGGEQDVPRQR
jgi:hypothetical protein